MAQTLSPLQWLGTKLIRGYQLFISPMIGPRCRFTPTCSQYAIESIKVHGFTKGCWLTAKRLLICHPFSNKHGYDPVPDPKQRD